MREACEPSDISVWLNKWCTLSKNYFTAIHYCDINIKKLTFIVMIWGEEQTNSKWEPIVIFQKTTTHTHIIHVFVTS